MNREQMQKYIGRATMSVVDAMEMIDNNSAGILYIIDEDNHLLGSVTDGDIRRFLIRTANIQGEIQNAMQKAPRFVFEEERARAEEIMTNCRIKSIPVVNHQSRLVDILFYRSEGSMSSISKRQLGDVSVVIMAGGKGTRLYPYTKILPKPLIPIGDVPIVERILNYFYEYGIGHFYMTVNYKSGMIKSYFQELSPDYEVNFIDEEKPLGTGGSLRLIPDMFERPIIVTNCDSLVIADYAEIYDYHCKAGNDITVIASIKNVTVPYGVLKMKENGELDSMEEKPKNTYLINTGMYILNPEMISFIPENTMYHMTYLLEDALKKKKKVGVYPISEDSFLDMGETSEMKRMEEKLGINMV